ncbi:MAG: hypothetical protein Q9214_005251, partial [Letrouitia sp. 1 TL-2023]
MPEFVDYLSFFGRQMKAENLYYSRLYQKVRVNSSDQGVQIPERHWSGYDLSICYSFKAVEPSKSQETWPWSIRHCAVYHSFDLRRTRAIWVIIKGDDLIERRIKAFTKRNDAGRASPIESLDRGFAESLAINIILAEWSVESWSYYIEFLEAKLDELTDGIVILNADAPVDFATKKKVLMRRFSNKNWERRNSQYDQVSLSQKSSHPRNSNRAMPKDGIEKEVSDRMYTNAKGKKQPMPPGRKPSHSQGQTLPPDNLDAWGQQQFSFRDLQKIQDLEERANEAAVVLKTNARIVSQLRMCYLSFINGHKIFSNVKKKCKEDVISFVRQLDVIENSFHLQILRLDALLHLLAGRRDLLHGILDFRNVQASQFLAQSSQDSAQNMEDITHDMRTLARKTKTETVSMKIITLVTLFFLPGTFIS